MEDPEEPDASQRFRIGSLRYPRGRTSEAQRFSFVRDLDALISIAGGQGTAQEIALAHELIHVLTDNGEHSTLPGNLMRDETAPQNTNLTPGQCSRIRQSGSARGLLEELK